MRTVVGPGFGLMVQLGWKRKLPLNPRSNAGIFFMAMKKNCAGSTLPQSGAEFAAGVF
jgi:hypothetical protein